MMKSLFPTEWEDLSAPEIFIIKEIACFKAEIKTKVDPMVEKLKVAKCIEDPYEKAMAYYEITKSFNGICKPINRLEGIVDDNTWSMQKYRELLWIR